MRRIKRRRDPEDQLREASRRADEGDLDGAQALLTPLLERPGSSANARRLMSAVARRRGAPDEALLWLEGLGEGDATPREGSADGAEDQADVLRLRADALLELGRLDEAHASLDRALRLCPEDPRAYEQLAAVQRARGDLPAALEAVDGALALEPQRLVALQLRGSLLEALGEGERAVEAYRDAVRARLGDPASRVEVLLALATLLEARGELEEAEQARTLARAFR